GVDECRQGTQAADRVVLHGAHGLRAVEGLRGNLDLAQRVPFGAHGRCHWVIGSVGIMRVAIMVSSTSSSICTTLLRSRVTNTSRRSSLDLIQPSTKDAGISAVPVSSNQHEIC